MSTGSGTKSTGLISGASSRRSSLVTVGSGGGPKSTLESSSFIDQTRSKSLKLAVSHMNQTSGKRTNFFVDHWRDLRSLDSLNDNKTDSLIRQAFSLYNSSGNGMMTFGEYRMLTCDFFRAFPELQRCALKISKEHYRLAMPQFISNCSRKMFDFTVSNI